MLAKQWWRFLSNPDSLCAKVYKARYYPNGDVLNSKLGCNPSYTWRSIFKGLEVIRKGTRWRIGNGSLIHIWEDKWLPTPTTFRVISPPRLFDDFPMVFSLIDEDARRWKVDTLKTLFLPFKVETILNNLGGKQKVVIYSEKCVLHCPHCDKLIRKWRVLSWWS